MDFSAIQNYCPMKNKVGKQNKDRDSQRVRQTDRRRDNRKRDSRGNMDA